VPKKKIKDIKAKKSCSLRQVMGKNKVVRLLHAFPILDDQWMQGADWSDRKKYLVIQYPKGLDNKLDSDRVNFAKGAFTRYWFDDWKEAQDKYIELCGLEDITANHLLVGKKCGDD